MAPRLRLYAKRRPLERAGAREGRKAEISFHSMPLSGRQPNSSETAASLVLAIRRNWLRGRLYGPARCESRRLSADVPSLGQHIKNTHTQRERRRIILFHSSRHDLHTCASHKTSAAVSRHSKIAPIIAQPGEPVLSSARLDSCRLRSARSTWG